MTGQRRPDVDTGLWRRSDRLGTGSWQVGSQWIPPRRSPGRDSGEDDVESRGHRGWGPREETRSTPLSSDPSHDEALAEAREEGALTSVIEGEVIPRLLKAYRGSEGRPDGRAAGGVEGPAPSDRDVETLARVLVAHGNEAALALVNRMRRDGVDDDLIYARLLDPVARRFDEQWNGLGDAFTDVSLAVERLHRVLHDLDRELMGDTDLRGLDRRVLVAAVPGEEPTCAGLMVATLFRRAGWDVVEAPPVETYEALMRLVREEWLAVAHLSVTRPCRVPSLARGIECLRRASDNQKLGVVLGGVVVRGEPSIATRVGADAATTTGPEAVERAEGLLGTVLGTC